jgi:hypothetical protein
VQPNNRSTNKDKDLFFTDIIPYRLRHSLQMILRNQIG